MTDDAAPDSKFGTVHECGPESEPPREHDAAKRLILARRARFVAAALAGAGMVAACDDDHARRPTDASREAGADTGPEVCLSQLFDAGPEVCLTRDAGPQVCLGQVPEDAGDGDSGEGDSGEEDAG